MVRESRVLFCKPPVSRYIHHVHACTCKIQKEGIQDSPPFQRKKACVSVKHNLANVQGACWALLRSIKGREDVGNGFISSVPYFYDSVVSLNAIRTCDLYMRKKARQRYIPRAVSEKKTDCPGWDSNP